jgi:hypothetical protein
MIAGALGGIYPHKSATLLGIGVFLFGVFELVRYFHGNESALDNSLTSTPSCCSQTPSQYPQRLFPHQASLWRL